MSTTEPVVPLPGRPSLEQLKNQARELQRESGGSLTDAQLQLARRHGFASWPKLKAHVDFISGATRTPDTVATDNPLALVCLTYGTDMPDRWARGSETIKAIDVWSAAALCDLEALRTFAADATKQGGPFDWEPLLHLCYARVTPAPSEAQTLGAATFLLDNGADPNAGYLWHGLMTPFTALTGAFGGGEQDQPPHPHSLALARLLLGRGADPNDAQALYNRMFSSSDDHLELLVEFGLGKSTNGVWSKRLGPAAESVEQMLGRQMHWAALHDLTERIALLERLGVTNDVPPPSAPLFQAVALGRHDDVRRLIADGEDVNQRGRGDIFTDEPWETPLHTAAHRQDATMIRLLLELGADPSIKDARFDGTPRDWAEHFGDAETAALFD